MVDLRTDLSGSVVRCPLCLMWVEDEPGVLIGHITRCKGPPEPYLPEWDPGPEIDDEGGMSEYRYGTERDFEPERDFEEGC